MKYLSILGLLFFSTLLLGQQLEPNFNTVIAPNGLKLRSAPSLNSEVVCVLPYRSQIVYLDAQPNVRDTIGRLANFPGMVLGKDFNEKVYEHRQIVGHWVHVRRQKIEGYVFNPYLGPGVNQTPQQDYFLISPGENCGDQFYDLEAYNTYGIYRKGQTTWTEAIKVSYVLQTEGIGFLAPILTTSNSAYLQHVIGSRKSVNCSQQSWSVFYPSSRNFSQDGYEAFVAGLPEVVVSDSLLSPKEIIKKAVFLNRSTGRKQTINDVHYGREYQVIGKGDVDGDGRTDILLEFRNAELLTRRLYLSSLAAKGDFYGLAAEENFGYCC